MALTEDYDRIKMVDIVRLQQEKTRHPQVHERSLLFIWIFNNQVFHITIKTNSVLCHNFLLS